MQSDYLNRYDLIQRLRKGVGSNGEIIDPYYSRHDNDSNRNSNPMGTALMAGICIGAVLGMVFITVVKSCVKEPQPAFNKNSCSTTDCHSRKMAMEQYFERSGNKHPVQMAEAVLATKRPKLIAAIAVKGEKNTPYTVRKGGYKKRHAGFGQVSEKDWGKVPYTPVEQAKQIDNILDDLLDKKPVRQALSHYGGDSTNAYQKRVLAELSRVP